MNHAVDLVRVALDNPAVSLTDLKAIVTAPPAASADAAPCDVDEHVKATWCKVVDRAGESLNAAVRPRALPLPGGAIQMPDADSRDEAKIALQSLCVGPGAGHSVPPPVCGDDAATLPMPAASELRARHLLEDGQADKSDAAQQSTSGGEKPAHPAAPRATVLETSGAAPNEVPQPPEAVAANVDEKPSQPACQRSLFRSSQKRWL